MKLWRVLAKIGFPLCFLYIIQQSGTGFIVSIQRFVRSKLGFRWIEGEKFPFFLVFHIRNTDCIKCVAFQYDNELYRGSKKKSFTVVLT